MPKEEIVLHLASEAVAIFVVAPVLFYIAARGLNNYSKAFLILVGVLTLLVDGFLFYQWVS